MLAAANILFESASPELLCAQGKAPAVSIRTVYEQKQLRATENKLINPAGNEVCTWHMSSVLH